MICTIRNRHKNKLHYKNNLLQLIKNLVIVNNLFIDKIFEESNIKGSSPKTLSGSLLKNSNFSNLNYSLKTGEESDPIETLVYPLRGIEDFIVLLKATNIDKVKDYIILYTLLDIKFKEDSEEFKSLIFDLNLSETYNELKFYWTLESAFVDDTLIEKVNCSLQVMSKTKALWTSSILQTLLELSHLEAATVFINMDQLDLSQHKSLELIIYTYWITGMYSQAFMLLLLKENDINSLRYKNVFSLFVNIMLNHKQFETLCSFSLSEKQEELIKEILCDSRLLCYYLPFTDSRKCLLDGLSKAKELFKKLHQEKEKAHGYSARDAQINYKLLGNLIKMYMHNLKFYDKFEEWYAIL